MAGVNPLEQSDEDFLNSQPPEVEEPSGDGDGNGDNNPKAKEDHDAGDPPIETNDGEGDDPNASKDGDSDPDPDPDGSTDDPANADDDDGSSGEDGGKPDGDGDEPPVDDGKKPKEPEGDGAKPDVKTDKDGKPVKTEEPKEEDPSGSGFTVPKSFKANGRDIELKSEAEALQLMQMGANFTRKMQELAPHRKMLMMVQNNKIDEGKLSFLIDLDKGDPEAIKKLIKDADFDINTIDSEAEPNYLPGSHMVGDDEVGFRTVIEEVSSTTAGKETISSINADWDDTSKEVLWKQPELLTVFHEQRQSGVYDRIKAEVDRRISLGQIPTTMPFLTAYKQVGDEIVAEMASQDLPAEGQQQDEAKGGMKPNPVATRKATPKATVDNGDKASAASSSRSTPGQAKTLINPLSMSDDQFLKEMENRV